MLTLYLLVRQDMPSQKFGKGSAQAAHAANQFTDEHIIRPLLNGEAADDDVMEWRQEANGFGTTITLGCNFNEMNAVVAAATRLGFKANTTIDPEYPYIVDNEIYPLIAEEVHTSPAIPIEDKMVCFRKETTTAYVFGEKDDLTLLMRRFKLLDNT